MISGLTIHGSEHRYHKRVCHYNTQTASKRRRTSDDRLYFMIVALYSAVSMGKIASFGTAIIHVPACVQYHGANS